MLSYALLAGGALGAVALPVLLLAAGALDPGVMAAWLPLAFYLAGALAVWKSPGHPAAQRLLAVGALHLLSFALAGLAFLLAARQIHWAWLPNLVSNICFGLGFVAVLALYAVFPDGAYRRSYERIAVRAALVAGLVLPSARVFSGPAGPVVISLGWERHEVANPIWLPLLAPLGDATAVLFAAPLFGLVLLGLRYRGASAEQRAQMRWPFASAALIGLLIPSTAALVELVGQVGQAVIFITAATTLPASLVVGMLRHRLFDIDLVIRRSVVYGSLWLAIALTYAALAAALGVAAGQRFPVAVAVVVAIAAAMLFQPARRALEHLADRLVFGERLGGYELMRRFGATLESAVDPKELASRLAATVRRGLDARWVRVGLRQTHEGASRLTPAGADGVEPGEAAKAELVVPLVHGEEHVGVVECGPKRGGDYTPADRELLAALARQAALGIRNARLAAEVTHRLEEVERQACELAASRTRIVQAAETERRRVERDLHDGVQQQLVALMARAALARAQVAADPVQADATLAEVQSALRQTHADLRDLVRGIHPAVLSDRGLAEAAEARASQLPIGVAFRTEPSVVGRRFDPEIEGAAYFLISEALTNVMKHAAVDLAAVCIDVTEGRLVVEVADAGRGFDPSAVEPAGLGGLRDRLEALGGSLDVVAGPGQGTRIVGTLPARERRRA